MINQKNIEHWGSEHFLAYLYLVVADADNETTEEEITMAARKLKKLVTQYYKESQFNTSIVMNDVLGEIMNHTDNEKTDMINNMNKLHKFEEDLQLDLISDLTDIIQSDDKVSASEHYILSFIRVVLSKN